MSLRGVRRYTAQNIGHQSADDEQGRCIVDWTLELIVVPVSDMDRAKDFYLNQAGFDLLVDHAQATTFVSFN